MNYFSAPGIKPNTITMSNEFQKRPPLGLRPEYFWRIQRLNEIDDAMRRYFEEPKLIPHEWFDEYSQHKTWCDNYSKQKQASKLPIKDYEIVKMIDTLGMVHDLNYNHYPCGEDCKIFSVRRLSDGEVFGVSDITDKGKIIAFEIADNEMIAKFADDYPGSCASGFCNIGFLSKIKQPEPLFTERCNICGGELVMIRSKYPGGDKRKVCPACNTERLDQINEISNKNYGVACSESTSSSIPSKT